MPPRHSARLTPLRAETSWTLDGGDLVERRGGRERRLPLSTLRAIHWSPGGAILRFPRARLLIPARSLGSGLRSEDRRESFEALMAAVSAAAPVQGQAARLRSTEPVLWLMGLTAAGALALLVFAASAGAWEMGLALASRLLFVLILGAAILPWLGRPRG